VINRLYSIMADDFWGRFWFHCASGFLS